MALSILNNIPSLAAQNQMTITNSSLQKTLFRLSSGSRINSGADDAAGLAIADGLRANVTALTQSSRNATDGIGKLQVADGALAQVTNLLNRAVTLATESSTGTLNGDNGSQRTALNAEFLSIKAEIDRIGQNTTFNGAAIFSTGTGTGTNPNQLTGATTVAVGDSITSGDTIVLNVGGTKTTFTAGASETVGSMLNTINSANIGVVATVDGTGVLTFDSANGSAVAWDATSTYADAGAVGNTATTNGNDMSVFLSDSTGTGTSTISVTLNAFDSSDINGADLSSDSLVTSAGAKTALTHINNAISNVAALRGTIGAGINRLQAATDVMSNQVQNLSGAEDSIRSADIAQEVANMTKFNILSQTGISALAQANQMQQGVLSLLR